MAFLKVFRRSIIVGLALALLVLVAIDVTAYLSSRDYSESVDVVKRTYQVLNLLRGVTADLVSAESEVRGFVVTGDVRYLSLYEIAARDVGEGLEKLKNLMVDPVSLELLEKFEELSIARLGRLEITLDAMRAGGIEAVRQVAGPGKDLMDSFRESAAQIELRQLEKLDQRDEASQTLSQRSNAVILLGSTFAVILLIFSMLLLGQQLERRDRLEREVLEISEREQRRIGQDLHDGVCQQLTGVSLLSRSLSQKLDEPESAEAGQITDLINDCIEQTRRVTRGLHPVQDDPSGLMQALKELAEMLSAIGHIDCRFLCPVPVAIPDRAVATNLYRIVQEATQNALRHADPSVIEIKLSADDQTVHLSVSDDGCGLGKKRSSDGIGMEIMDYRARSIGAKLEVRRRSPRGTLVACDLPLNSLP
jgi:signal transduction histidine kinase